MFEISVTLGGGRASMVPVAGKASLSSGPSAKSASSVKLTATFTVRPSSSAVSV